MGRAGPDENAGSSGLALSGRVAAVTGAGQGNGRAIAGRLAQDGATVFISDIRQDLLEAAESEIAETGAAVAGGVFDASKVADADRLVAAVVERFGRIDVMVNNAGGIRAQEFPEVTEETWDWSMDLNLKGFYFHMQQAAKRMMEQHSGTIINIASIAGIAGGVTLSPPYAASKAAVINLTKVAAVKVAEYGVTVNAVAPGIVDTAFNWTLDEELGVRQQGLAKGEFLKQRTAGIPLGRISQPEDVANAVAFLASPDAAYITGETIVVSGGLAMR